MSIKRESKSGKEKSVGYGYVGVWNTGDLGWVLPEHLTCNSFSREFPDKDFIYPEDDLFLCKITVELVKDRKGRPIIRHINKDKH
jgi:hypothetical protein